jgi:hypothetical protein
MAGFAIIPALLMALLLAYPAAAAQAGPVTANRFVLVDDQGQVRASLGMAGAKPTLALYDAPKVAIGQSDSGDSFIALAPPDGSNGGTMFLSASPIGSRIAMSTVGAESPGLLALVTPQTGGAVLVRDSSGNLVWSAP